MVESNLTVTAIVPCGGVGRRMGKGVPKQFIEVAGRPILIHTLQLLDACPLIHAIILVIPDEHRDLVQRLLSEFPVEKLCDIVAGGKERQDSVRNGLKSVPKSTKMVLVHDGVRPMVSIQKVKEVIRGAERHGAAILAVPIKDTVKSVTHGRVNHTVDREKLWAVQTPQVFHVSLLQKAYSDAESNGWDATDDAGFVEMSGHDVYVVQGEDSNIKITTPDDLRFAEMILGATQ